MRTLLFGLLRRMLRVRMLSVFDVVVMVVAGGALECVCSFRRVLSGVNGYGVRTRSVGSEYRVAEVSIGGGTTWTAFFEGAIDENR